MKTNRWIVTFITLMAAAVSAAPSTADDLTGAGKLLCSSVEATVCDVSGDCEMGPPWNWDIPQFIEVDLSRKMLSTTPASGENRSTPILNIVREQGVLFLQGVEGGRAFSFVINQSTGAVSAAVARDGITVSVFGACTPIATKG
jgi:hypothetical protein